MNSEQNAFDEAVWACRCQTIAQEAARRCGSIDTLYTRFYSEGVRDALDEVPEGMYPRAIEIANRDGDYMSEEEDAENVSGLLEDGDCIHGLNPNCCPSGCGEG